MSRLTDLVDFVVNALNNAGDSQWGDLKIGTGKYVAATPAIDPLQAVESATVASLFIVPVSSQINRQESMGRQKVTSINKRPIISCLLTCPVSKDDSGPDITSWAEGKKFLNLREEIDEFLVGLTYPNMTINDVNIEPAQEVLLGMQRYVTVTEIEFENMKCG